MSKPARLYPKPEPVTISNGLMILGCGVMGIAFFILGLTFQNISMVVWGGCINGTRYVSLRRYSKNWGGTA